MYKLIAILLLITNLAFSQNADDIIGKYHLSNNLDVEIFKENNTYFGKIIALNGYENGLEKDVKNPEDSLKDRLLIGLTIIKNLTFNNDEKQWINGEMYGAEKGMFFNLKITEIRKNEIEVVGSKFLFWKTLTWKKI